MIFAISLLLVALLITIGVRANEVLIKAGGRGVCENASWLIHNSSEEEETEIEFDIGPFGYAWEKTFKRTIDPGGFQANAIAKKSTIKNNGPGDIQVNCQKQSFDRHDWKMDAGSGKTYQTNPNLVVDFGLGKYGEYKEVGKDLFWNVWAQNHPPGDGDIEPAIMSKQEMQKPIGSGKTSYLVVDLAPFIYSKSALSASDSIISPELKGEIESLLKDGSTREISLQVLILPDPEYFDLPWEYASRNVKIDLQKIRCWETFWPGEYTANKDPANKDPANKDPCINYHSLRNSPIFSKKSSLLMTKDNSNDKYSPGFLVFELNTKVGVVGTTSISLAFWTHDDKPMGEIELPICVKSEEEIQAGKGCIGSPQFKGLSGTNMIRFDPEKSSPPEGALHFVGLGKKVKGIFHAKDFKKGKFIVWTINQEPENFIDSIKNIGDALSSSSEKILFEKNGEILFSRLFGGSVEPHKTQIFKDFIKNQMNIFEDKVSKSKEHPNSTPPSLPILFIRMLRNSEEPIIIPFGLTFVNNNFLGFQFNLEVPLNNQNYLAQSNCIKNWTSVFPSSDSFDGGKDAVLDAVSNAEDYFSWSEGLGSHNRINQWIKFVDFIHPNERVNKNSATSLLVLSHQDKNNVYFNKEKGEIIDGATVNKKFKLPSFAIINSCGSGKIGSSRFIHHLNVIGGFHAIIGTNTEVEPKLAGDFLNCFAKKISENRNGITVSQAFSETIGCLKNNHGTEVLKYMLMGNGNLKLCPKQK